MEKERKEKKMKKRKEGEKKEETWSLGVMECHGKGEKRKEDKEKKNGEVLI